MNSLNSGVLARFIDVIGSENVMTELAAREIAATATYLTRQRIAAILRPSSTDEIRQCLAIANEFRLPLYPISGGKNWGYGSRVPVISDSVLIDLGRMNRIIAFDEDLAYVTVEPGVTMRQLSDFLKARNSSLWMSPTTGSADGSLIGVAIERGFGRTPMGDFASNTCDYQIILPDGQLIETGMSKFPNAKIAPLEKWGLGPSAEGLFVQSSLGIVTRMTFWLMPAPDDMKILYLRISDDETLVQAIDALRPLRIRGSFQNAQISNEYRYLARVGTFPWNVTDGEVPLPPKTALELARNHGFEKWNIVIPMYGNRWEIAATRKTIEEAIKHLSIFKSIIGRPKEGSTDLLSRLYYLWNADLDRSSALARAYWRKRPRNRVLGMDLDRDRCGVLFVNFATPFTGEDVRSAQTIIYRIFLKYGFEPDINFGPLRPRTLNFNCIICFDRDEPDEDKKALACYQETREALREAGYYPLRLGIHAMDTMNDMDQCTKRFAANLKNFLDPRGILSLGRYETTNKDQ